LQITNFEQRHSHISVALFNARINPGVKQVHPLVDGVTWRIQNNPGGTEQKGG
jgi:hypothetical protein